MTIKIDFPKELEDKLRRQAALAGQDVDSFIRQIVAERLAKVREPQPSRSRRRSNMAARLDAWIALHPVLDHPIDDSRESIYSDDPE